MHLDPHRLRAFLARPEAFPELVQHLAQPCSQCEEVLAQAPLLALDGVVDAAALSLAPRGAADEVGFARVQAALRPPRPWSTPLVAVGLAGALALGLFLSRAPTRTETSEVGVKGTAVAAPLGLAVAARHPDGSYRPVGDGDRVAASSTLVFQYDAVVALDAELVVERPGRAPERLGAVRLEAGRHDLRSASGVLALSLDGEVGSVGVWLVGADGSRAGVRVNVDP